VTAWFKSLPSWIQSALYAIETGVAAALVLFLASLYSALTGPHGLDGFDWAGQLHTLEIGAAAAVVKAILDLLKGNPPAQQ
jgi:hypothetical protein